MQRRLLVALLCVLGLVAGPALVAGAQQKNEYFHEVWSRTDKPVAWGLVDRTWLWGPEPNTEVMIEPYAESPDGKREVQYYDKARMEITHPDGDRSSIWYVTNGRLVVELVTGQLQLGDDTFKQFDPAAINVAGDPGDPNGPTYATFSDLLDAPPIPEGNPVTLQLDQAGNVTDDPALAERGVTAAHLVLNTNHTVASVFWDFMTSTGTVYEDGEYVEAQLFENEFYATGLPITEPYWTTVTVGGTPHEVLVQAFERRVLTYTPANDPGWQVEAGNVGQHYYHWRYDLIPAQLPPAPGEVIAEYDLTQVAPDVYPEGGYAGEPTEAGYGITLDPGASAIILTDDQVYDDGAFSIETHVVDPAGAGQACIDVRLVFPNPDAGIDGSDYSLCLNYSANDDESAVFTDIDLSYFDGSGFNSIGNWDLPEALPAGEWTEIMLMARGHDFWIMVNGEPIANLTHQGALSGTLAFSATDLTPEGDTTATSFVEFRNLLVRAVE